MGDGGYRFSSVCWMHILKWIRTLGVKSFKLRAGLKTFPEKA